MQVYKAPLKDMKFLLRDFLNSGSTDILFNKSEIESSDLEMVLDEAAKLCEEILLPINQSGDVEGCNFEKGKVTTPKGFKEAYKSFIENGAFDQLDCEVSGGPNKKGHYLVFCEFNRNEVLFREISEVVTHIYQVANIKPSEWRFRAYRNETILPFNEENFAENIITDPATYKTMEELADPGTDEEQSAETTLSTEALEYRKRYQFLANY